MEREIIKDGLTPLNSEISEFQLKALEKRLETDPLAVGGLLDIGMDDDDSDLCSKVDECSEHCSGLFVCNGKGK